MKFNKIKNFQIKTIINQLLNEFSRPYKVEPCKNEVIKEMNIASAITTCFPFSFFIIIVITNYALDDFKEIPIIITALVQFVIFYLVYSKKLYERNYDTTEEWFHTKEFKKLTTRYIFIRKEYWTYFILLMIILSIIFSYPFFSNILSSEKYDDEKKIWRNIIYTSLWIPLVLIFSTIIFRIQLMAFRDFNFYFALGVLKIITECDAFSEVQKFRLYKTCLVFYNYYLQSTAKISLKNIDMIYSKTIANTNKSQDLIYKELQESFSKGDNYEPLKYFEKLVGSNEPIVTEHRIKEKIRLWLPIIISLLVGVFSIYSIIFPK